MKKVQIILITFITVLLNIITFAQQEKYTAPVNWRRYKISEKQISVLLPKMPVFHQSSSDCNETESNFYAVYAEGVVYQLQIVSKSSREIPKSCEVKNEFGKDTFERRLKELKMLSAVGSERKFTQDEREVVEFQEKFTKHLIFNDLKNNKWIEISATHREDTKPDFERFGKLLQFDKNPSGIEIGSGALGTLGDANSSENETNSSTGGVIIVSKVPPRYTDAARNVDVQGTVTLRITFLDSGGIGSVSVVSGLPLGLTEQAIAAAKKITFLPARRNGKNFTVVKTVQYSFKIY